MEDLARRMMALFAGHEGAHGTHGAPVANPAKGNKLEIKSTARTLRGGPTLEMWMAHLRGEVPLGIIPIRADDTCWWGCIDIDRYDIVHTEIIDKVSKADLPLVIDRSKSGGAHAYLFLAAPQPAVHVLARLREVAAAMGWGDCEIFPKQTQLNEERGDFGNWMRMPYFGQSGYGVKARTGLAMTLGEFVAHAEASRTDLDGVVVKRRLPARTGPAGKELDSPFADGPPCLQHLAVEGFPDGTRNNGLFGIGIYAQRRFGDDWPDQLRQMNQLYMSPPLDDAEVEGLILNLQRREYQYKCKDQPCVSHCNSALCRTRKYGVGGGTVRYPEITGIRKLDTDPPLWFLDVDDGQLELTTRQLLAYREFQEIAYSRLTRLYSSMKQDDWHNIIQRVTEDGPVQFIEVPPETSIQGHFTELLGQFLTDRYRGRARDDLLRGKPFLDDEEGVYFFRLQDLMRHLDKSAFTQWGRNVIAQRLRTMGGNRSLTVAGRGVSVFYVPKAAIEEPQAVALPAAPGSPI